MGKYCCFLHPQSDFTEKELSDLCPKCGRPYGFPLDSYPGKIGDYQLEKELGRGFYSATFLVSSGRLGRKNVLKVIPKLVYSFFEKDFIDECEKHSALAQESEHICKIEDYFDATAEFDGVSIECWVAVIEYLSGESLRSYLSQQAPRPVRELAQVAVDMYRILSELDSHFQRHNDLHGDNIIIHRLEKGKRADALSEDIKVYLIDLGSVGDASKSDGEERLGDRHWVARHFHAMTVKILSNPDGLNPLDYRLATTLAKHVKWLSPPEVNSRHLTPSEAMEQIERGMRIVKSPWRETTKSLKRLSDTYNAQSLDPWFIPSLIVDPEGLWEQKISAHGPQIITGMRGCGKTLFLKSLHFHARAVKRDGEKDADIIARLKNDSYMGLYASASDLLVEPGSEPVDPVKPFERLLALYAKDALYALRHLEEIDRSQLIPRFHSHLGQFVADCVGGPDTLRNASSDFDTEIELQRLLLDLEKPDATYRTSNPIDAFVRFADMLRSLAACWANSQILYLLDDVSTRYLPLPSISKIISTLLYQKPNCAFKITTEGQTFEEILRSPGLIERAAPGRDYEAFDLGAEVFDRTRRPPGNDAKPFIQEVLEKRIKYYDGHPKVSPAVLLGDRPLVSIARAIAESSASSNARKSVYSGITALSKVCVGDIGDVILLYEEILRMATGQRPPVSAATQTEAMLRISSDRLWRLDKRGSNLKDFAKTFADAAYSLLVASQSPNANSTIVRLRQYAGIYVRVTAGDTKRQFDKLRELIDAGVFVFHGGAPRTKTRDGDPSLQFKLTYRKLYGLNSFIGLSDRDRFELSGDDLAEWLDHPERGKEILTRNLGGANERPDSDSDLDRDDDSSEVNPSRAGESLEFPFEDKISIDPHSNGFSEEHADVTLPELRVSSVSIDALRRISFDTVVLGLGFEDRTLESARRIFSNFSVGEAVMVRYDEPGHSAQMEKLAVGATPKRSFVNYRTEVLPDSLTMPAGRVLVDVTGLAKPAIFRFVRGILCKSRSVFVCRTQAKRYYPSDDAINPVLKDSLRQNRYELLKATESLLTGEQGPYKVINLYSAGAGAERRRVICAFASPKHERLMTLLDERGYDRAELISHPPDTPRGNLALLAAEIATDNYRGRSIMNIPSDDLSEVVKFIFKRFDYWFVERGFNFEVGLTGSKLQTVACAAASAVLQFTNVWYVYPKEFDPKRFTEGVGESAVFELRIDRN